MSDDTVVCPSCGHLIHRAEWEADLEAFTVGLITSALDRSGAARSAGDTARPTA